MHKKFWLMVLAVLCMLGETVYAQPVVGVILDGPSHISTDTEKLTQLDAKLAELLPQHCRILPANTLTQRITDYRVNHGLTANSEVDAGYRLSAAALSEDVDVVDVQKTAYEYRYQIYCTERATNKKVFNIGPKPTVESAMDNYFKHFLKRLTIKNSAIPTDA